MHSVSFCIEYNTDCRLCTWNNPRKLEMFNWKPEKKSRPFELQLYWDKSLTTGWNDRIVALEKTTWFHFRLMKNRFSFFLCWRPSTSWPVVYKSQELYEPSIMSESDTMFNERDRRSAAVKFMLSTDPSYHNRTIARTLKMQIWIATNNRNVPRVMKTKFPATVIVFGVGLKWGPYHDTSHLRSRRESQHQSVPGCAEECGDHLV